MATQPRPSHTPQQHQRRGVVDDDSRPCQLFAKAAATLSAASFLQHDFQSRRIDIAGAVSSAKGKDMADSKREKQHNEIVDLNKIKVEDSQSKTQQPHKFIDLNIIDVDLMDSQSMDQVAS